MNSKPVHLHQTEATCKVNSVAAIDPSVTVRQSGTANACIRFKSWGSSTDSHQNPCQRVAKGPKAPQDRSDLKPSKPALSLNPPHEFASWVRFKQTLGTIVHDRRVRVPWIALDLDFNPLPQHAITPCWIKLTAQPMPYVACRHPCCMGQPKTRLPAQTGTLGRAIGQAARVR